MNFLQMADLVLYFAVFSFLGWVCETIFCSIQQKKFVPRGFLNLPVCPIYGFGGIIVVYILAPLKSTPILLFITGMVCASVLEYITSYLLEKLFNVQLWDYSNEPFNINGRICLPFALMFGVLSIFAVYVLYPPVSNFVENDLSPRFKIISASIIAFLLVSDTISTVSTMLQLKDKLKKLKDMGVTAQTNLVQNISNKKTEIADKLNEKKDKLEQKISHGKEETVQSVESLKKQMGTIFNNSPFYSYQLSRLLGAFPNMQSKKFNDEIRKFKENFKNHKK